MEFTKDELDALDTLLVVVIHALDHSENDKDVEVDVSWMDLTELQAAHDKIYAKINY